MRAGAADAGLDAIFVPLCVDPVCLHLSSDSRRGVRSDCRYLTQMENAAVVLPTDGRPPIVINERGRSNEWVPDARSANRGLRGSWSAAMAEALLNLGLARARIGVTGLTRGNFTHVRAYDGVVNYSSYVEVVGALPHATFENATDVVGAVRFVHSEEEIACLRRSSAIAEAGIAEMAEVARPGVAAASLYARVTERMLELGSERHDWALYLDRKRYTNAPLGRPLRPGDYITNEVSAVWGEQLSQEDQPIILGPVPEALEPLIELQRQLWHESLAELRPGRTFAEVLEFMAGFGPRHGIKSSVTAHGRGLGNEGPIVTSRALTPAAGSIRLQPGNTFVWKPNVASADGTHTYTWAGCVVVGEHGAEGLPQRPVDIISIR